MRITMLGTLNFFFESLVLEIHIYVDGSRE